MPLMAYSASLWPVMDPRQSWARPPPRSFLYQMVEKYAEEAKLAQSLGFDGCFMHMAYRLMFPGRFLSPLSNKRTDEFGGSVENRARFPLMICEAIKKACGKNFLVEISISGREDDLFEGGATVEDQIELAKLCSGKVDILQIRGGSIDPSQPTYLDLREIPNLDAAARIRRGLQDAGVNDVYVDIVGGCQDFLITARRSSRAVRPTLSARLGPILPTPSGATRPMRAGMRTLYPACGAISAMWPVPATGTPSVRSTRSGDWNTRWSVWSERRSARRSWPSSAAAPPVWRRRCWPLVEGTT